MVNDSSAIIGAHGIRNERDFYPTPREVTQALLNFLESRGLLRSGDVIWECACGGGAMADVFRDCMYPTYCTDIVTGTDFLTAQTPSGIDWIITNPPFNRSVDFIKRALRTDKPFAFLLKSQYWHSSKRFPLFRSTPPSYVLPLTWRPDFTGQGSSLMDVMWCVWLPGGRDTIFIPIEKPKTQGDETQ